MKIFVTICTRARHDMLRDCLFSVLRQRLPKDVSLCVVVIENDEQPNCSALIEDFRRFAPNPIIYLHEARLGIPIARNRALDVALREGADWIAFIDDDETAAPDWIANFYGASGSVIADVFQGPVVRVYPDGLFPWSKAPQRKHKPTGQLLRTAATSNTFMRAHVARADGLGLRFNEEMRFTGGSDTEFFFRASDRGARICWLDEAVAYEHVPPARLTLKWELARSRRVAANAVTIQKARLGLARAAAKCFPKYLGRLVGGVLGAPVGAMILVFSKKHGRHLLAKSLCGIASAIGGLGAFVSVRPQPYLNADGAAQRGRAALRYGG
jgi:succinoglycan biosynthesis protein ExoM